MNKQQLFNTIKEIVKEELTKVVTFSTDIPKLQEYLSIQKSSLKADEVLYTIEENSVTNYYVTYSDILKKMKEGIWTESDFVVFSLYKYYISVVDDRVFFNSKWILYPSSNEVKDSADLKARIKLVQEKIDYKNAHLRPGEQYVR